MKIGVIADMHIPEESAKIPQQILETFKSVDMIIHAGDHVDLSVLNNLQAVYKNVRAVWGNMDNYEIKNGFPKKIFSK